MQPVVGERFAFAYAQYHQFLIFIFVFFHLIYSNQESHSESQGVHDNVNREDDDGLKDESQTAGIAKSVMLTKDEEIIYYDGENINHKTVLWFVFGIMHIYRRKSFKDLSRQDHTRRYRYSYLC